MSLSREGNMSGYYAAIMGSTASMAYFIAHRNQAILSAAAHLPPPVPPATRATRPALEMLRIFGLASLFFAPGTFVYIILPSIKSQLLLDCFTLAFAAVLSSVCVVKGFARVNSNVYWDWQNDAPVLALLWQPKWSLSRVYGLSAVWTAVFIALAYFGQSARTFWAIYPLLDLYGIKAHQYIVKRRFWKTSFVSLFVVGTDAMFRTFPSTRATLQPSPSEFLLPSEWMWPLFYPLWFAACSQGFLADLSIALRFDAAQIPPILGEASRILGALASPEIIHAEDKVIATVGQRQKNPRKPLFMAGFITLIVTTWGGITYVPCLLPEGLNLHPIFFSAAFLLADLTEPVGIAFWAVCTGKWKEWYNYNEQASAPSVDVSEKQAMDDVEALLDGSK